MMRTYQRLRVDLATMRTRTVAASGDFSLFSVVEQALTRAPGKDKIGSITPAEKTIPGGMTQYHGRTQAQRAQPAAGRRYALWAERP